MPDVNTTEKTFPDTADICLINTLATNAFQCRNWLKVVKISLQGPARAHRTVYWFVTLFGLLRNKIQFPEICTEIVLDRRKKTVRMKNGFISYEPRCHLSCPTPALCGQCLTVKLLNIPAHR